nr:reverse transcriptase domain-containing protein [Tanacetum cinerariifolium]
MASKQFSLKPGLSKLNETGKSSNLSVSKVDEALTKDLEDLFQDFYDEYFDSSKIMKSSTTNVETPINDEVFHEVFESFQGESSSSSLNDDVQQSPEEVILPSSNTQSISINMTFYQPYPLTTLESSLDSSSKRSLDSSPPSPEPSRKRSRSPTTLVPSSILVSRSIVPTHADLLPPRKRLRNSYSPEDSIKKHMKIGTTDAEAVVNLGIRDRVGVDTEDGIGMGVKIATSDIREDEEEFETAQRQLEAAQLIDSREKAGLTNRIRMLGRENLRVRALLYIGRDQVDSLHHHMALSQEEFHKIHSDRDDARRRLTRLESFVERRLGFRPYAANTLETKNQSQNGSNGDNGNGGNGDGGNNENRNPNKNGGCAMPVARMCTYQDFVKCQPLNFKGTEGVIGLTRWFEKMETMFHIKNYPKEKEDRIEKYVGGLPDNIRGNVMSVEPTIL